MLGRRVGIGLLVAGLAAIGAWLVAGRGVEPDADRPSDAASTRAPSALDAPSPTAADLAAGRPRTIALSGAGDDDAPPPPPVDLAQADRDLDLHGVVVHEDGMPVTGARLSIVEKSWRRASILDIAAIDEESIGATTRSSTDGSFAFRLRRGQRVDLRVEATGLERFDRPACLAGERLRLVLRPGVTLTVVLVNEAGAPVASTIVRIFSQRDVGNREVEARTPSDAAGHATFPSLPGGTTMWVDVQPSVLGAPTWVPVDLPGSGTRDLRIVLVAGRTIAGRVTDATTGRPIAGARVGISWMLERAVLTDAEGRYAISGWSEKQVDDDLHAEAEGFARASAKPGDRATVDFALGAADVVVGRVVDAKGGPIERAYVATVPIGPDAGGEGTDLSRTTRTDAAGRFRLTSLSRTMPHAVVVTSPGHGRTLADFRPRPEGPGEIDLGDVVLVAGLRIEGRVLDADGGPVPGARLTLEGANADRSRRMGAGWDYPTSGYGDEESARSDDLGRFRFDDLSPGTYSLTARPALGNTVTRVVVLSASGDVLGADLTLARTRTLLVHVSDSRGRALAHAFVRARDPNSGTSFTRTEADGTARLSLSGAVDGLYVVWSEESDPEGRLFVGQDDVQVPPGATSVSVTLEDGHVVAGIARDGNGAPVALLRLEARRGEVTVESAQTDAAGRFRFVIAGEAPVSVVAVARRSGTGESWHRETWAGLARDVAMGAKDVVVVATPVPADRSLSVRLLQPDGRAAVGASVLLVAPSWTGAKATTDADGRATFTSISRGPWQVQGIGNTPAASDWLVATWKDVTADGQTVELAFRQGAKIAGVVRTFDGTSAPGVRIVLLEADGVLDAVTTVTDENGLFSILVDRSMSLPRTLVARPIGVSSPAADIVIRALPATGLDLRLPDPKAPR